LARRQRRRSTAMRKPQITKAPSPINGHLVPIVQMPYLQAHSTRRNLCVSASQRRKSRYGKMGIGDR
jgi:hypothetical protein